MRSTEARSTKATLPVTNHVYVIHWHTHDGYGWEEGITEAVYRGPGRFYNSCGKYVWKPLGGSPEMYLFADEVLSIAEESPNCCACGRELREDGSCPNGGAWCG